MAKIVKKTKAKAVKLNVRTDVGAILAEIDGKVRSVNLTANQFRTVMEMIYLLQGNKLKVSTTEYPEIKLAILSL